MRILGDVGQCTCRAMYGHYCYVELRRGILGYEVLCTAI